MGLFNACEGHHTFCMLSVEMCRQKISALEIFDFLKGMGVTSENINVYVEAFKKWNELGVNLTPLRVVYLAEPNRLIALPFFDCKLARFVVGIEVEGTCFFPHYQKKRLAPLMPLKQAHSLLLERTTELLKIEGAKSPRILAFPTTVDLENWSENDPEVAQTLSVINLDRNYVSRRILSYMRCENGTYWIDPTLRQSLAKVCAKLKYSKIELREPQSEETFCRAMTVAHLDPKYDFCGGYNEFGEFTPQTVKELARLRELSEKM